jgi:purine-binding chemotaxis protein CheW
MTEITPSPTRAAIAAVSTERQYLTFMVAEQTFGVPALLVHDVLGPQRITRVPLAPPEIAGSLNLRGRVVTAIELRLCLRLPKRPAELAGMSIVVEHDGVHYSLIVDQVGEVLTLPDTAFERSPATLDARWRTLSLGVHRLDSQLLVLLDVARLLDFPQSAAA